MTIITVTTAELAEALKTFNESSAKADDTETDADLDWKELVTNLRCTKKNNDWVDDFDGDFNAEEDTDDSDSRPLPELRMVMLCGVVLEIHQGAGYILLSTDHEPNPYKIFLRGKAKLDMSSLEFEPGDKMYVKAHVVPLNDSDCRLFVYDLEENIGSYTKKKG